MNIRSIIFKGIILITSIVPVSVFALTERVNIGDNGIQGNSDSNSSMSFISDDGRYVLFSSYADNLVPNDTNGQVDVFLRDTLNGVTTLVSSDSSGNIGNNYSQPLAFTPDGRYVMFSSYADNLVPNDTNGQADVFVRDTLNGVTTLVSSDSLGNIGNNYSQPIAITPDGRYVLFSSYADNLVPNDTNYQSDTFVKDTLNGTTIRVSVDSSGNEANNESYPIAITPDGKYVLFSSYADNLISGDANYQLDAFVRDTLNGVTTLVSSDSSGNISNSYSQPIAITPDGKYVLFSSYADNLIPNDTNGLLDTFVKDTLNGTTIRVSVDSSGNEANNESYPITITPDGKYVLFSSYADNLVPNDTNGQLDAFVRDTLNGVTTLVSSDSSGNISNSYSQPIAITPDGKYVLFSSYADNLIPNDTNGEMDIFVKNFVNGETHIVSVSSDGMLGNNYSQSNVITSDGKYVVFGSYADNLVPGDTNGYYDIFVNQWGVVLGSAPVITYPLDGSYINDTGDINIRGFGVSGFDIKVSFLGNDFYTTVGSDNQWTLGLPHQLDATYTIYAQQKGYGSGFWSVTGNSTFTIDTINPELPTILSPNANALISGGKVRVSGTGEAGGRVKIYVGNETKTASVDNMGNWSEGPFTVLPGYKYEIYAKQRDIATNRGNRTDIVPVYGILKGVVGVDSQDFMPDLFLTKDGISSGSTTITSPNTDIQYTINYLNLGNAFSTGTSIYEIVPVNTCFRLGSIGLFNTDVNIEYSNNSGLSYNYIPVGLSGQIDCSITNFKITFLHGLDPKTNITEANLSVGDFNNIVGNSELYIENRIYTQSLVGPGGSTQYGYGATADFDGDGKYDILAMGFNGQTTLFTNTTLGPTISFSSTEIGPGGGSYFVGATTGDFNNDGRVDVVGFGYNGFNTMYTNTTSGGIISFDIAPFGTHERTAYHHGGAVGDFNNDGKLDIIAMGHWGNTKVYTNITTGFTPNFQQNTLSVGGNGYFVGAEVADFNNDGKLDVVGGGHVGQTTVFVNISTGSSIVFNQISLPAGGDYGGRPVVGDFNNDGKVDIVRPSLNNDIITNTSTGILPTFSVSTLAIQNGYLFSYDFNNDGKLDIISVPTINGTLKAYINDSSGNVIHFIETSLSDISSISPHGSVMADFNNDGIQDYFGFARAGNTTDNIIFNSHRGSSTGSYSTILHSAGNNNRNKLFFNEDIVSGENNITYTIFPVVNSVCDTGNILLGPSSAVYGELDIHTITGLNSDICIKADFTILTGSVSPVLKNIIGTWNNEDVENFTFAVKVKTGGFVGTTVLNTAYISSNTQEITTGNNFDSHLFSGLPLPAPPVAVTTGGGFGGGNGGGNGNGGGAVGTPKPPVVKEPGKDIKPVDITKPEKPVVEIAKPTKPIEPVTTVQITPTTPNIAIKEAIVQTSYVNVGQSVSVKTVENPVLGSEKKCYTPKEVVDITLGKNTTNKDLMVYQALLKSYDLTIFNDTDAYMPENGLKRYEAAKMFTNFAKYVLCREATNKYKNEYKDIDNVDVTLKPYIIQAYEYGILKGANGQFRPLDKISRKEFVAALMRMFINENMDVENAGNEWDRKYQEAFKTYGLESIVGIDEEIDRYDMSKIMYKLYYNTSYEWTDKGYVLPYRTK